MFARGEILGPYIRWNAEASSSQMRQDEVLQDGAHLARVRETPSR